MLEKNYDRFGPDLSTSISTPRSAVFVWFPCVVHVTCRFSLLVIRTVLCSTIAVICHDIFLFLYLTGRVRKCQRFPAWFYIYVRWRSETSATDWRPSRYLCSGAIPRTRSPQWFQDPTCPKLTFVHKSREINLCPVAVLLHRLTFLSGHFGGVPTKTV